MNARTTNPHGVAFGSEFGGGMSFREYVATHALVGFLIDWAAAHGTPEPELAAQAAVAYADALIAELSKPKKGD